MSLHLCTYLLDATCFHKNYTKTLHSSRVQNVWKNAGIITKSKHTLALWLVC